MKSELIQGPIQIDTCPKTRVMGGQGQLKHFYGWVYDPYRDQFLLPESKDEKGFHCKALSIESFDRLMAGWLFHVGWKEGSAEYSTSASHTFTHSRVAEFPKLESRA